MMTRRKWLAGLLALFTGTAKAESVQNGRSYENQMFQELEKQFGDKVVRPVPLDLGQFPYSVKTLSGAEALQAFESEKAIGGSIPVILGDDKDAEMITEMWSESPPNAAAILAKAETLGSDFDIVAFRKLQVEAGEGAYLAEEGIWPAQAERISGPTVVLDPLSGQPLPKVYLVLLPAKDSTEIPAYLAWGAWNECPPPEVHVAMLRKWNRLYGAELVAMAGAVINLRVTSHPSTREEAMVLAKEMYFYCADIVDQGTGDLAPLAAMLMESDYWYFWWD